MGHENTDKLKLIFGIISIIIVSLISYHNSHNGDFCYDDHFAIKNNNDSTGNNPLFDLFKHDFWGQDITLEDSHKSYRPITVLSFRLNYWIYNYILKDNIKVPEGFDVGLYQYKWLVFGLHLTNTIIHTIVSIQVFFLAKFILKLSFDISLGSALLFASHPIHTEAVSNIVGRAELISTFFALLSLFLYSKSIINHYKYLIASVIFAWISILSKETAFSIFPIILLWDILKYYEAKNKDKSSLAIRIVVIIFAVILYLWFRTKITVHFTVLNYRRLENPIAFSKNFTERWLSTLYLHSRYVLALFKPWPLSCDWSYNCIPLVSSILDPRNLLWITFYAAIISTIIVSSYYYVVKKSKKGQVALFLVGFAGSSFFPASNIILFVGTMLAERVLYLPSIPFTILVSFIIKSLGSNIIKDKKTKKLIFYSIIVVILSIYISLTLKRNLDWENEERLFESALEVCPDSGKVNFNMAILRINQHNATAAEYFLKRTLSIVPEHCEVDFQYGILYWSEYKDYTKALTHFKKSLKCKYTMVKAATILRDIYNHLINSNPNNGSNIEEWSDILHQLEQNDAATDHYIIAANVYFKNKDIVSTKRCVNKAYKINPSHELVKKWMIGLKSLKND